MNSGTLGPIQICLRLSRAAGILGVAAGLIVLLGWFLGIPALMAILPGAVTMKANTALGFVLAGFALIFLQKNGNAPTPLRTRRFAWVCAGLLFLNGALTVCEHWFGWNFGIDQLIIHDAFTRPDGFPGRMAPASALAFAFLGLSQLLIDVDAKRVCRPAQFLALMVSLIGLIGLIGYIYDSPVLHRLASYTSVAVHSACLFAVLGLGTVFSRPTSGLIGVINSNHGGGLMARRILPVAMTLPFVLGWLQIVAQRAGWFGKEFGLAMFVTSNILIFATLVWISARTLNAFDSKRERAEESLREAHAGLEHRVVARTTELAEAQKRLQEVLEAATGVSVIAGDVHGTITLFNTGAERMLGYRAEEIIGKQTPTLFHLESEVMARGQELSQEFGRPIWGFDVFAEYARQGRQEAREWTYLHKDGHALTVALGVTATRDESGGITGFLGIATDITERKQAEIALEEAKHSAEAASQAKSEFLANMSHEIRTPMNGIIGMTDLALETNLNRNQRESLEMVKTSAHALLGLINDILDFSKIEAGKLELESIDFSLRECVSGILRPLGIRADQKNVELIADIPVDVPDHLVGDPMRLRQILINLTDNAIKFTSRGEVVVKVTNQVAPNGESHLHFSVADTGIGIPAEKQSTIFEAFAQADGSTTRTHGGTGLGLSIASMLIRKMRGKIWIESKLGAGTTFHFTARLGLCGTPLPTDGYASSSAVEGLRALVVDDNASNRRVIQEMLTSWRLDVTGMESGALALEEMGRAARAGNAYQVVLADALMPEMDGFTLLEKIREQSEFPTPTLMLMLPSAVPFGTAERCEALGIAGFLTKPVTQSNLLDAILLALNPGEKAISSERTLHENEIVPTPTGLRILVAEDNVINRAVVAGILGKQGHSLAHVADGRGALRALRNGRFDLILMDMQMPEMDGFEATRRVREMEESTDYHTPIVAMTAHAMAGDRERCLSGGMDDYVSKPIRKEDLLRVVADWGGSNSAGSVCTREELLEQCDGDEELMGRLISLFLQNTPEILAAIREAIAQRDGPALARGAHKLMSSIGAVGAQRARAIARRLEEQGERGDIDGAREGFAGLEREINKVYAALADFVVALV